MEVSLLERLGRGDCMLGKLNDIPEFVSKVSIF